MAIRCCNGQILQRNVCWWATFAIFHCKISISLFDLDRFSEGVLHRMAINATACQPATKMTLLVL
jgi:hypothetical protein